MCHFCVSTEVLQVEQLPIGTELDKYFSGCISWHWHKYSGGKIMEENMEASTQPRLMQLMTRKGSDISPFSTILAIIPSWKGQRTEINFVGIQRWAKVSRIPQFAESKSLSWQTPYKDLSFSLSSFAEADGLWRSHLQFHIQTDIHTETQGGWFPQYRC